MNELELEMRIREAHFDAMEKGALAVILTIKKAIAEGQDIDSIDGLLDMMEQWHTSGECKEEVLEEEGSRGETTH